MDATNRKIGKCIITHADLSLGNQEIQQRDSQQDILVANSTTSELDLINIYKAFHSMIT